jgi:hypothetical protein
MFVFLPQVLIFKAEKQLLCTYCKQRIVCVFLVIIALFSVSVLRCSCNTCDLWLYYMKRDLFGLRSLWVGVTAWVWLPRCHFPTAWLR